MSPVTKAACLALLFLAVSGVLVWLANAEPQREERTSETFDSGLLDLDRWVITREGDFSEATVDVVEVGEKHLADFRLRLRANTRGTRSDTVKTLGVRTAEKIELREGKRIAVELDWNEQTNGTYLSAGLVLSPDATAGNPLAGKDWLKVVYVGVPPGRNARRLIVLNANERLRTLDTDGWPDVHREGRRIGVQALEVETDGRSFRITENGTLVYESAGDVLSFGAAYLYLQASSHSNYPAREVYFDNVRVSRSSDRSRGFSRVGAK